MALPPKRQRFVEEYLANGGNATQAAIAAGYAPKSAEIEGSRLLADAKVFAELTRLRNKKANEIDFDATSVLKAYITLARADIRKAVRWGTQVIGRAEDGSDLRAPYLHPISSDDIDDATAYCISEIAQTKDGIKIKFVDKKGALDSLAKYFGLGSERVDSVVENMPEVRKPEDALRLTNYLLNAAKRGDITLAQASVFASLASQARAAIDTDMLAKEVAELREILEGK